MYTVTVTVSDDDGGSDPATFQVTVDNVAPTLTVAGIKQSTKVRCCRSPTSASSPIPASTIRSTSAARPSENFTYSINWGDGTPADSGAPTIDVLGMAGTPTPGSFDGSHIYADNGMYTVTVTVSDDDGGSAVPRSKSLVNNVAPTLVVPGDQIGRRRRAADNHGHRPVHRPRLRQPTERRRRDDRTLHLRHRLGRRHDARLGTRHQLHGRPPGHYVGWLVRRRPHVCRRRALTR